MTLTPPAPEHSWPPGRWLRLWNASALDAPQWYQTIVLNQPKAFAELLAAHPGLIEEQHGNRSVLEWAVRWGRVGVVRQALRAGAEAGCWQLVDSLQATLPNEKVWAVLAGGLPSGAKSHYLVAALGRCDAAGDRFFLQHAKKADAAQVYEWIQPDIRRAGWWLARRTDSADRQLAMAFDRALALWRNHGQAPDDAALNASLKAWLRGSAGAQRARNWEQGSHCRTALWKALAPSPDTVARWLEDLLQSSWRDSLSNHSPGSAENLAAKAGRDAAVAAALGEWAPYLPGQWVSLTLPRRLELLSIGPKTLDQVLAFQVYHDVPADAWGQWFEGLAYTNLQSASNVTALQQWAENWGQRGDKEQALSAWLDSSLARFALTQPGAKALIEGLLTWWKPSEQQRRWVWSRTLRGMSQSGQAHAWITLLLGHGWPAQEGLESLAEELREWPGGSACEQTLKQRVVPGMAALQEAGAHWHTPAAQAALNALGRASPAATSPATQAVWESWRLQASVASPATSRSRCRL